MYENFPTHLDARDVTPLTTNATLVGNIPSCDNGFVAHKTQLIYTSTYKSEARASPPGLSIRMIAALYFFDSGMGKRVSHDRGTKIKTEKHMQITSAESFTLRK